MCNNSLHFFLAAIGFILKENVRIILISGKTIPLAALVGFIGIIPLGAFYLMDKHWYHRLLNASVEQGMSLEKEMEKLYPNISLTIKIKEKSPISLLFKKLKIHSNEKITIFYFSLGISILIISYLILRFSDVIHKIV